MKSPGGTSLSRPAISHHLKILKEAGIVDIRQEGTANYYYLTLRESNRQADGAWDTGWKNSCTDRLH